MNARAVVDVPPARAPVAATARRIAEARSLSLSLALSFVSRVVH